MATDLSLKDSAVARESVTHIGYHDLREPNLDNVDPNLPSRDVVQDLYT